MNCSRLHLGVKTMKEPFFKYLLLHFLLASLFLVHYQRKGSQANWNPPGFTCKGLDSSLFHIGIIASVRYNHMVGKMDSHDFSGLFHALGQHVIVLARMKTS